MLSMWEMPFQRPKFQNISGRRGGGHAPRSPRLPPGGGWHFKNSALVELLLATPLILLFPSLMRVYQIKVENDVLVSTVDLRV